MQCCKEDAPEHPLMQRPNMKLADKTCSFFFFFVLFVFFFIIHCELDFYVVPRDPENSSHCKTQAKCIKQA